MQFPGGPVVCGRPRPAGNLKKKKKWNVCFWKETKFLVVFCCLFFFPKKQKPNPSFKCFSQRTSNYLSWIQDNQVAGFYQQFGNLTFLTVKVTTSVYFSVSHWNNAFCFNLYTLLHDRELNAAVLLQGAGHMVPQWAPGPALHMFQSFLNNMSYWCCWFALATRKRVFSGKLIFAGICRAITFLVLNAA